MALSDGQKRGLIIGVGIAAVAGIVFWSRRSSAATLPPAATAEAGQMLPSPSVEGGMPTPSTPKFADPATGALIDGPSTQIVVPSGGQDTIRTVEKGESWSNMASRAYGDYRWWPYIWDHNRTLSVQFGDPDQLRRGDTVRIPPAPPMSQAFQAAIFERAKLHRDFWLCQSRGGGRSCEMDAFVYTRTPLESA